MMLRVLLFSWPSVSSRSLGGLKKLFQSCKKKIKWSTYSYLIDTSMILPRIENIVIWLTHLVTLVWQSLTSMKYHVLKNLASYGSLLPELFYFKVKIILICHFFFFCRFGTGWHMKKKCWDSSRSQSEMSKIFYSYWISRR